MSCSTQQQDLSQLCELLIAAATLHDEQDLNLERSERLNGHCEAAARALLTGHAANLGQLRRDLAVLQRTYERAQRRLARAQAALQRLEANTPPACEPRLPPFSHKRVDALLGLVDGVALLEPVAERLGQLAQDHLARVRTLVERVLLRCSQGRSLDVLLIQLESERQRLHLLTKVPGGEGPGAGSGRLAEAVYTLIAMER